MGKNRRMMLLFEWIFFCMNQWGFILCLTMLGIILFSLRGDACQANRQPRMSNKGSISHIYIAGGLEDHVVRLDGFSAKNWISYGMYSRDRSRNDDAEGRFDKVTSVAVDDQERIYITDEGHKRLCRVDDMNGRNWIDFRLLGSPLSVYVTRTGRIYVLLRNGLVSGQDHLIRMEDMTGRGLVDLPFSHGPGKMQLHWPYAVFVDAQERIYLTDSGNARIIRMDDMQGNGWITLGTRGKGKSQFGRPSGIFVTEQGQIYIADQDVRWIVRFDDMSGKGWTVFYGARYKHFLGAYSIWIGKDNRIYYLEIIDNSDCKIVRMDNMKGDNLSIIAAPTQGIHGQSAIVVR